MYPNLYYAFKDLFGLDWPFLRFVNSFGFFVAIAFLVAAALLSKELRRKSSLGYFQPTESTIMVGEPASLSDLLTNFLLGFILGFKVIALFLLDKDVPVDPPSFIFSTEGNWLAGIGLGVFLRLSNGGKRIKRNLRSLRKE